MFRRFLALAVLSFFLSPCAHALQQINLVGEIALDGPLYVALDPAGNLLASLKDGTVVLLSPEGRRLARIGGKDASGDDILKSPTGVAFGGGRIYVADRALGRVLVFSPEGALLESFGAKGSDPGEFNDPGGIAVFGGVIYVADRDNDRVQVFGPNGVYMQTIGRRGSEEELLDEPTDLALDHRGNLYVVDDTSRVKVYAPSGEFLRAIEGVERAFSIAMAPDGFFLADTGNFQIAKYGFEGERILSFGSKGKGRGQFRGMAGVAADAEGRIYVADSKADCLQSFLVKGAATDPPEMAPPPTAVLWKADLPIAADDIAWDPRGRLVALDRGKRRLMSVLDGRVESTFSIPDFKPYAVSVDALGNIWALDKSNNRLAKLDEAGNLAFTFGAWGSSPGSFSSPRGLAVSKRGAIIVADTGNGRVQTFSSEGIFLMALGKEGGAMFERPIAVALDGRDNIHVLDGERKIVSVFSADGAPLKEFGAGLENPVDMAVNGNEIFVLDGRTCAVKVFDHEGNFLREFGSEGKGRGKFRRPQALALKNDLELLVADPEEETIQAFLSLYTPAPPENLSARPGMRQVRLRWDNSAQTYVEAYRVYRRAYGQEGFEMLAEVARPAYRDDAAEPGKMYTYRVTSVAAGGRESAPAEEVRARATKLLPSTPTGLTASAQPWTVTLSWEANREEFIDHYVVYRKLNGELLLLAEPVEPRFTDDSLASGTTYDYLVAAVSTDEVESKRVAISATTAVATRPPVEVEILQMHDIFSGTYKIYENEGIGLVRVTNHTSDHISRLKVFFTIKDFMDFPSEVEIENLPPGRNEELLLKAVFNNNILNVSEDTPVQAEIKASYFRNQENKTYTSHHTLKLYERHRMSWDVEERFAAFISPKDPAILEFARSVATRHPETDEPVLLAGALFHALGLSGVTYVQDPSNPYQVTSGDTRLVDYIQYPRETLERRSGDCDDLVGLYASLLESLGIPTRVLSFPGHMFMMFATGLDRGEGPAPAGGLFAEVGGDLWVPVEVTRVGSSFMKAWQEGARAFQEWDGRGLSAMDLRAAWQRFKPATLPASTWRAAVCSREEIEERFPGEFRGLKKVVVQSAVSPYLERLKTDPSDIDAALQLGIRYARYGEIEESVRTLAGACKLDPDNAALMNNLGNAHFLAGSIAKAQSAYRAAADLDPGDPRIWVNLARCDLKQGARKEAAKAFRRAIELEPALKIEYGTIALELAETF